ncbi:MAG: hypothetical protein V4695_11395 [Pseudomonadota bacterium]
MWKRLNPLNQPLLGRTPPTSSTDPETSPTDMGALLPAATLSVERNRLASSLPDRPGSIDRKTATPAQSSAVAGSSIFDHQISHWIAAAPPGELGMRTIAAQRMKTAQMKKETSLTLNGLLLTSLPESFAKIKTLKKLDLSNNCLTHLPELPSDLIELGISNNQISELRQTFSKLKFFDGSYNNLSGSLDFPEVMDAIILRDNLFTGMPTQRGIYRAHFSDVSNNPFNEDYAKLLAHFVCKNRVHEDGVKGAALLVMRHAFSKWHPADASGSGGIAEAELGKLTRGNNNRWQPLTENGVDFAQSRLGKLAQSEHAPLFVNFLNSLDVALHAKDDASATLFKSQINKILTAMLECSKLQQHANSLALRHALYKWQLPKQDAASLTSADFDNLAQDESAPIFIHFMNELERLLPNDESVSSEELKDQISVFLQALAQSPRLR